MLKAVFLKLAFNFFEFVYVVVVLVDGSIHWNARVAQCRARKTPQAPIRPFIFLIVYRRAVAYGLSEVAQSDRAPIPVGGRWFEPNP